MPPEDADLPDDQERRHLADLLDSLFSTVGLRTFVRVPDRHDRTPPQPAEYNNANFRICSGSSSDPARFVFPPTSGGVFDNNAMFVLSRRCFGQVI